MCVCVCAQSCPTLCDPIYCSPPSSSLHGVFQGRILEWVAISYSRRSSWPKDQTYVSCASCLGRRILYRYITCLGHFSRSVVSESLQHHGLHRARCPWPSLTPEAHSNPCPLSRWCHPTISSSVIHFSSCPQSFPASGSFPMSHFFTSSGQSIGISASTSVLPKNTQDWSPLEWTGWISLQSKGLSRVFSNVIVQKHQFFGAQLSL